MILLESYNMTHRAKNRNDIHVFSYQEFRHFVLDHYPTIKVMNQRWKSFFVFNGKKLNSILLKKHIVLKEFLTKG